MITYRGEDEAVTGIVMMLLGSNSRDVIYAVKDRVAEIQASLPPGVVIETIYDRADFVERTLTTVMTNLVEGALVVFIVLVIFLGSIRGALVCVVGIPASMTIALFGMHWAGVTGDLMSLGAIDFGFLVDGPIVVLEALLATYIGKQLTPASARGLHRTDPARDPPGRLRGRDHHARVRPAARPRGRRGPHVPADGDDHGLRAARRARLLGAVPAGAAGHLRAAAQEGRRPLAGPIGRLYGRAVPGALRLRWPLIFAPPPRWWSRAGLQEQGRQLRAAHRRGRHRRHDPPRPLDQPRGGQAPRPARRRRPCSVPRGRSRPWR
jgi:hypothetical protein